MRLVAIARHPVKSLQGEQVEAALLDARGVVGDRLWAVLTEDGGIGSGKTTRRFRRIDGLLRFRARTDGGEAPLIRTPEGRDLRAGDPATDDALSAALGRPVRVRAETTVPHHDDSPLHLVTSGAIRALEQRIGAPVDARRFRANLVLDADGADEASWAGARLAIGDEVVLRVGPPMPRCRMVDLEAAGERAGARVLTALPGAGAPVFGLQASVEAPGTVRAGDAVRVVRG